MVSRPVCLSCLFRVRLDSLFGLPVLRSLSLGLLIRTLLGELESKDPQIKVIIDPLLSFNVSG